jgi:hypothetical protein
MGVYNIMIGVSGVAIEVFNRFEKKYLLRDEVYRKIKLILEDYMDVDPYSRNGDFYTICSIYYDSPDNRIIRKSLQKPTYKEKLRLRSYGVVRPEDKVYLEIKKKCKGFVNKRRTSIILEDAISYFETMEKPKLMPFMNNQILNEIDYIVQRYYLRPAVFLSYERNALFGKEDDSLRITFDTNVFTRRYDLSLDKGIYGDRLLSPGLWIMEVKVTQAIPIWLVKLLSTLDIYPASYSKYGEEYRKTILTMNTNLLKREAIIV